MELLRDEVLPHSQHIPHQFILRVVMLLNKGSIHSATTANIGTYNIIYKLFTKTLLVLNISSREGIIFFFHRKWSRNKTTGRIRENLLRDFITIFSVRWIGQRYGK